MKSFTPATHHPQLIFGTRAIIETILAGQTIDKVFIDKAASNPLRQELLALIKQHQIPYSLAPATKLNRLTQKNHQGAIAYIAPITLAPLSQIVQGCYEQGKAPLLLLLDGITDVRNFGAIVRTAACTAVDAVVIPSQGSAPISGEAMKTSAGALAHVPICRVGSLREAIQYLRESGLQVMACSEKATDSLYQTDLNLPLAILLGAEDQGIAPQHLQLADKKVQIPIAGPIASLNVAVAAAVVLYEHVRQRK
ncbi:MAG: 23S rRNA (guanosine(2251)-2'-O)-methyltransferase RlmB [Bacteroidota bacterium]